MVKPLYRFCKESECDVIVRGGVPGDEVIALEAHEA
jgi:hypothetical protein